MAAPIFILAGEPSGDRLGASLMQAISTHYGKKRWIGTGGPAMQAQGLKSHFPMEELTVFGFGAAVRAYPRLSRRLDMLVELIVAEKPDIILTVDAKGFAVRLAERLRRRLAGTQPVPPMIHTVAPTIWAWGQWRGNRFAHAFDGMLCLFPFEPDYMSPLGLDARFISHPEAFNPAYDVVGHAAGMPEPAASPHLTLLPGSRRSEIDHLLDPMLAAISMLRDDMPDLKVQLPTLPHLDDRISASIAASGLADTITVRSDRGGLFAALAGSHAVMATSGTVTLQTALFGLPGVACYKAPALSAFIGRRLVRLDRVILPNALLAKDVYPFLFQENVQAKTLYEAMLPLLMAGAARQKARKTALANAADLRRILCGKAASFEDNVAAAMAAWLT
ncbi:MAG: lipid-A-disaccharide synthase [Candidatus Puniceispirillaceae bacterium]